MVQSFSLGAGVLAGGSAMDLEPPPGTGTSPQAGAGAHHRVCACHPITERTGCHPSYLIRSYLWIRSTHHGHVLENGALHRSRLFSPARWDASLPSWETSSSP